MTRFESRTRKSIRETQAQAMREAEENDGGITPEGISLGHRYVMGHVNAYCPQCSRDHSEREGRDITALDCDYDLDK